MIEKRLVHAWGRWERGGEKREVGIRNKYKKTFGGYGYVQYLDCDDGFSHAKTSNCTT